MHPVTALHDANVLFPATLRSLLLHLSLQGLFQAKWSDSIHREWMRNVLKLRPDLTWEKLERTRLLMDAHVLDALVTAYEPMIEMLALPDPDDRHVLAAAIVGKAKRIVTFNLTDFPATSLSAYGIEAWHPDDFVTQLIELYPEDVCMAVKRHRTSLKNPPKSASEYLATLEQQGLLRAAALLNTMEPDL